MTRCFDLMSRLTNTKSPIHAVHERNSGGWPAESQGDRKTEDPVAQRVLIPLPGVGILVTHDIAPEFD